jgi:hypothetical protein
MIIGRRSSERGRTPGADPLLSDITTNIKL